VNANTLNKYCDKQGNEINDEQLLKDIASGANVISYHEEKQGEETFVYRENKRIVRGRNQGK
jgi:hypothetical protein